MSAGPLHRRTLLRTAPAAALAAGSWLTGAGLAGASLAGCSRDAASDASLDAAWVGSDPRRAHALQAPAPPSAFTDAVARRADVLVVGAGIAGLAAARGFRRAGVDDVHVLELEDAPGGNARGHRLGGFACPLGAHYLPLPGPEAHEVSEWLHELGLLRTESGRTLADERHLCHAPQERVWFDGAWHDGLLPPQPAGSAGLAQAQHLARRIRALPRFALPAHRAPWTAEHAALDALTFDAWLTREGVTDALLRTYLDYCCRDDYGAGLATVSAWAGVHYFASRHGFEAGGEATAAAGARDGVFTWPEGNGWLVERLAAPLGERLHTGRAVHAVRVERGGVQVWARHGERAERWQAGTVVLALPLFVAARLLDAGTEPFSAPLRAAAGGATRRAPWLVANLLLDAPLVDRPGVAAAWDNVVHGSALLGYVDARHQSLAPRADGATVLTVYEALAEGSRATLLERDAATHARRLIDAFAPVHPDLRARVRRAELARWGHAMPIPLPGRAALAEPRAALRGGRGRVRFAHADLSGYSVFEEAFTAGCDAARAPPVRAR